MEIKAKVRKFAEENKYWILGGCIAGYLAISVWEATHLKTVYTKDWDKVTGEGPFDELLDKPIVKAFATVEYEDGEIGVIKNVAEVVGHMVRQGQDTDVYKYTDILIDNPAKEQMPCIFAATEMLKQGGLDVTLI